MYQADSERYQNMKYNRCGRSGLLLPAVSLGLWKNFGEETPLGKQKEILFHAFDLGITHFDLANNYGDPAVGAAEENFGRILKKEFAGYRDEMVISSKAGFPMWPGPYGNWGSRKSIIASCDQSLKRMGLDYVDIFYHHRPDPETPLEESMGALSDLVRQGKALYVGISNYSDPGTAAEAVRLLKENGTPCLIHQPRYNMLEREAEEGLFAVLEENGVGCICYSPLAQGVLTNKYRQGIPAGSRAARGGSLVDRYMKKEQLETVAALEECAARRGRTMAQLALSWVLRRKEVTSVLIGASSPEQLDDNVAVLKDPAFTPEEERLIDTILGWKQEN